MAKSNERDISLDPRFSVPPGVIDVRQQGQDNGATYYDSNTLAGEGPILRTPSSTVPMPPSAFSIVEQRVRIGSDGRAVVDVTLEFADVPGINSIDVRVTKA